jgi:hypothetical protein
VVVGSRTRASGGEGATPRVVKLVDARHATAARIAATERLEVAVRAATQLVQPTAARCAGHGRTLSAANGAGRVAIL